MKNQLTNIKPTTLALSKSKSLLGITAKILEGKGTSISQKKPAQELATHEDIVMINGLMWEKETNEEMMDRDDAIEYAKNLRLGGYDDWRLPTKEELWNIVTLCGGEPYSHDDDSSDNIVYRNAKNATFQEAYRQLGFVAGYYWSSNLCNGFFWGMLFGGSVAEVIHVNIRCVRTVQ